jgi:hypothetical protein
MKRALLIAAAVGLVTFSVLMLIGLTAPVRPRAPDTRPENMTQVTIRYTQTELEQDVDEPEKPLVEAQAEAMKALAEFKYEVAKESLSDVISRMNRRSPDVVPYLIARAQALHAIGYVDQTLSAYREALAVVDRTSGPESAAALPILRALIAAHDDHESEENVVPALLKRYQRVVATNRREALPDADVDDTALLAPYIAAATENDKVCSCKLSEQSEAAAKEHGERSYIVALLSLKTIEIFDAEDDSPEEIKTDENALRTILSIMDERVGPTHPKLRPVLLRLVAQADENGKYDTAEMWMERLSMLSAK